MPPLTASDLVFSEQANHNFSRTLGDIKRATLSITNRLRSIEEDAAFAQQVAEDYRRPLIANERCGSWYIDPAQKGGSAYFKSTDGHTGVWKFSSRRLNLHLLEIIGRSDGCIIIDSTRRGKRIPDALSKTIPIWCCVLNRFLFPEEHHHHSLYTPPQVISETEHAQIIALIPTFLSSLLDLGISPETYRAQIKKPLRPFWVTPDTYSKSTINDDDDDDDDDDGGGERRPPEIFEDFHPVICCTVSKRVEGGEISARGYIQGAGDDTENWAHGLTAPVFWANRDLLVRTEEADLPDVIRDLVSKSQQPESKSGQGEQEDDDGDLECVKPTSSLFITTTASPVLHREDANNDLSSNNNPFTIILSTGAPTPESTWQKTPTRLEISLGAHKTGSRNLRLALPFITEALTTYLRKLEEITAPDSSDSHHHPRIIIACPAGKDLSIGAALAILCIFYNDQGNLDSTSEPMQNRNRINKTFIRQRMSWLSVSLPEGNPSRQTLQSVNSFLMERPDYC